MAEHDLVPTAEEVLARILPPQGYEGCVIVEIYNHLVWMKRSELKPTDPVCFYDGDCRLVLTPDNPLVRNYFR